MTWRSGLGLVDVAALTAIEQAGAGADRHRLKSARLAAAIDEATGLGPRASYDLMIDLAGAWLLPLPLVSPQGNFGSRDDGAAAARYTEARLSGAGDLVVQAEAARIAPVPIGLINGDTHRGGRRPPFDPQRIIDALLHLAAHPDAADATLCGLVGPIRFPGDCDVDVDLDGLNAGRPVEALLFARFRQVGNDPVRVAIDRFAPTTSMTDACESIALATAGQRHLEDAPPELRSVAHLPIASVDDTSRRNVEELTCVGRPGATFNQIAGPLRHIWPLRQRFDLQLPAPLPDLLREHVERAGTGGSTGPDGVVESLRLLEEVVP